MSSFMCDFVSDLQHLFVRNFCVHCAHTVNTWHCRDDNPAVDVDTLYAQKEPRDEADEALDNKNSFEHYEDQDMMRFSNTSSSHRY